MKTLRALAALLTYPTAELVAALGEIDEVLDHEGVVPVLERAELDRLIHELRTGDLYDLQRCRCISSSTCTARAETAVRPWSTC
jgi:nitrate reductase molybdenum cofactor assembly chaperone NarJ/NarW